MQRGAEEVWARFPAGAGHAWLVQEIDADANTPPTHWRSSRTSTTQLPWTTCREMALSPFNKCPVTSKASGFPYFFPPSPTHAGSTRAHQLDLNPDASRYESHIRKGKADVQQHLIIPPTLLLRREPPDALEAVVCSIPSPYAVPKGCLCFLQKDAGNLLLHEGREPHKANKQKHD